MIVIYGGFFSITKSVLQSIMILYVGVAFYVKSCFRICFPDKKSDEKEAVDMEDVQVEDKEKTSSNLQSTNESNSSSSTTTTTTTTVQVSNVGIGNQSTKSNNQIQDPQ